MRAGSEEDSDIVKRHAFLTQLFDSLSHKARLLILIARANDYRCLSSLHAHEQALLVTFFDLRDQRVGDIQYWLGAAEVLFEFDDLRGRKEPGELQHIPVRSPAKGVD